MSAAPRDVSFYIPARNCARTLGAAIASVRAQTASPAEIFLVVDQRSSDDTPRIARDSGLRIVPQTEGKLGFARNLALQSAKTRWLASCDADVRLAPDWLEALLRVATPECAAVGGATYELPNTPADRWRAVNLPHNWGSAAIDNPFMLVSEMLAQARVLRSLGGYRADLQYWEDSELCQRLREAGYTLRYQPAARAEHDRGDSIASVLELRWEYAAPRQRMRLESLRGIREKLAINRGYCLQSLSQTLHSQSPELAAICVLLWFHHAHRDLRAVLEKWPLLTPPQRQACFALQRDALRGELRKAWEALAEPIDLLLPAADVEAGGAAGTDAQRGAEGQFSASANEGADGIVSEPAAGTTPGAVDDADASSSSVPVANSRGFCEYLAALRRATRDFLDQIPEPLADFVRASANLLTSDAAKSALTSGAGAPAVASDGPAAAGALALPSLLLTDEDRERLAAVRLRPAWSWAELSEQLAASVPQLAPDCPVYEWGASLSSECPEDIEQRVAGGQRLVLLPHLETSVDPRATLHEALTIANVAVIAYRPADVFIPAIPILTARDLVAGCAAAGFHIRDIHTEPGLTRIIAQRAAQPSTTPTSAPAEGRPAIASASL